MTCIVGVEAGDRVYIGADGLGVGGHVINQRRDRKVFRRGPYVIGTTTSFRMQNLLAHSFKPPKPPRKALARFMATTFIGALRECFVEGGWQLKDRERVEGGTFLVGCGERLFAVYDDYQLAEYASGYIAVGSGEEFALGSLYSTTDREPRARVKLALQAAAQHCSTVGAPFRVLSTKAARS